MKIFIATPIYGSQCAINYTMSMLKAVKFFEQNRIPYKYWFQLNSHLQQSRNQCVHEFLESDCTHMLFVDYDVSFEIEDVMRMVYADKDIMGGLYPLREINWSRVIDLVKQGHSEEYIKTCSSGFCVTFLPDFDSNDYVGSDTVVEVKAIGTGYMLLKREAFEKLKPHTKCVLTNGRTKETENKLTPMFDFFHTRIEHDTGRIIYDDWSFCQHWQDHGGKIYAALWALGSHMGPHIYGKSELS
jgi:hypothetical protein